MTVGLTWTPVSRAAFTCSFKSFVTWRYHQPESPSYHSLITTNTTYLVTGVQSAVHRCIPDLKWVVDSLLVGAYGTGERSETAIGLVACLVHDIDVEIRGLVSEQGRGELPEFCGVGTLDGEGGFVDWWKGGRVRSGEQE